LTLFVPKLHLNSSQTIMGTRNGAAKTRRLTWALTAAATLVLAHAASIPGANVPRENFANVESGLSSTGDLLQAAEEASLEANYHRAVSLLEHAVRVAPEVSEYRLRLGIAYEREAESASFPAHLIRKARRNLERAVVLEPKNADAIEGLAELSYRPAGVCFGDLDEAAMLLDRLRQLDPARAEAGRTKLENARAEARSGEYKVRCGAVSMRQWVAHQYSASSRQVAFQTREK
jgi:tetratricopeptide (TPR) repeat protein